MSFWIRRDFVGEYVRQPNRQWDLTQSEERRKNLAALAETHDRILKRLGVSAVVICRQTNDNQPGHSGMVRILDPSEIPETSQAGLADSPTDGSGGMESAARPTIVLLKLGQ
jgi:hypothetical protein